MKELRLLYFAQLRAERGLSEEQYRTEAERADELYEELCRQYGLTLPPEAMRVAVNHRFASMDGSLQDGDTVAFVPPVSGG